MENKIYHAFDGVKASYQIKESTKQALLAAQSKKTPPVYRRVSRWAFGAVCMMLLLMAGFGGYSLVHTPVSYVSIDVNPSIELALNRFDAVVSATAYNEEGNTILKQLDLKGKKYTEAIDDIVNCEAMKPYLIKDSEVVFTVAASKGQENELKAGVEKCSGHISQNCQYSSADLETVEQAHEVELSLGKYNAYLQLSEYDETVTPDDCRHMSMSEIHCLVKGHEQGSSCTNSGQDDAEQGSNDGQSKSKKGHHHHGGTHK